MAPSLISIICMPINYYIFLVSYAKVVLFNYQCLWSNGVLFTATLPMVESVVFAYHRCYIGRNISLWEKVVIQYVMNVRKQMQKTISINMVTILHVQIIIEKPYTCYFCRFTKYGRIVMLNTSINERICFICHVISYLPFKLIHLPSSTSF